MQKTIRGIRKWLSVRMAPVFHPTDEGLSAGAPVFHPTDEDLSAGTLVFHPTDEDLSAGTLVWLESFIVVLSSRAVPAGANIMTQ